MRKLIFALVLLLFVPTTGVYALALTDISLLSGINQPLDARIPLRTLQSTDMETIRVKLADAEHFTRANLERLPILSRLQFNAIRDPGGSAYIHVTTDSSINEPFLSFIVEVSWSRGRILREYTLLLDPPTYTGAASAAVKEAETTTDGAASPTAPKITKSPTAKTLPPTSTATVAEKPASTDTLPSYGPVAPNDTLWSIATRSRPDRSVSIEQMMLALQQYNPEAFSQNNINALKAGAILRIPNPGNLKTIPQEEVLAEVKRQHATWEEFRQRVAANPAVAPKGSPVPSLEAKIDSTKMQPSGRVEVLSAGTAVEGVGQVGKDDVKGLRAEISFVKEELGAKSRENDELRSRLTEAEGLIQEFVHLMEIQSDEINALKKKLIETRSEAESIEPPLAEPTLEAPVTSLPTTSRDANEEDTPVLPEEASKDLATPETAQIEEMATEQEATDFATPPLEPVEPAPEITASNEPSPEAVASESESEWGKTWLLDRIHDNLIIIVAGLGAILILIGGWILWLRRRREIAEGEQSDNAKETIGESIHPRGAKIDVTGMDAPEIAVKKAFGSAQPIASDKKKSQLKDAAASVGFPVAGEIAEKKSGKPIVTADRTDATVAFPEFPLDSSGADLSENAPTIRAEEPRATAGENLNLDFGFDLGPETLPTPQESPTEKNGKEQTLDDFPFADMSDSSIDETQTQLDLAQAYIDMGDAEGARSILDKVLKKGSGQYKDIARELLEKLD